jgi:hypothetical protein
MSGSIPPHSPQMLSWCVQGPFYVHSKTSLLICTPFPRLYLPALHNIHRLTVHQDKRCFDTAVPYKCIMTLNAILSFETVERRAVVNKQQSRSQFL